MHRIGSIIVGFCVVLGVAVAGVALTSYATSVAVGRDLNRHRRIVERLVPRRLPNQPLLVWLGDSTMMRHQEIAGYPRQIRDRLRERVETREMYMPALDAYHHYFLMGPILEQEPDVIVIALHLRLFEPRARFPRRDLSSHIPARELPRAAALPLHERGITLPGLLLYRLLGFEPFERVYYFAEGQRQRFHESGAWALVGEPLRLESSALLQGQLEIVRRYDVDLHAGHPTVKMVGATVELAVRGGARVLAVVSPIPIHVLERLELYDAERYRERVGVLEQVVEANGGRLLDLHDLLGRRGFSDALGHMGREGTSQMVDALLPHVQRLVDEAAADAAELRSDARAGAVRGLAVGARAPDHGAVGGGEGA